MTDEWDASLYDDDYSFVHEYGTDVVRLLDPDAGERILDLGCGTGHLTARIADVGATAVGVDAAADMVCQARSTYPDLPFCRADARALPFESAFDAVFSNAALHWVTDPRTVVTSVHDVLVTDGRFVAEFGGDDNVSAIVDAVVAAAADWDHEVENPWYFPTVGEYATLLESCGFEVTFARLFERPTPLEGGPDGLREWLSMFGDQFFVETTATEREAILDDVEEQLRPELFDADEEQWYADYRRLRIEAQRPE
jgi:trans-aconitate methyltransferase